MLLSLQLMVGREAKDRWQGRGSGRPAQFTKVSSLGEKHDILVPLSSSSWVSWEDFPRLCLGARATPGVALQETSPARPERLIE